MLIYIPRLAEQTIQKLSSYFPAVAVVGPRQVGKTSLVQALRSQLPKASIYLDLEDWPMMNTGNNKRKSRCRMGKWSLC